ncbi:hypothetical protein D3C73_1178590 [compost metagenome]
MIQQLLAFFRAYGEILDTHDRLPACARLLLVFQHNISTDHQSGNLLLGYLMHIKDAFCSAASHDRNPITDRFYFLELV